MKLGMILSKSLIPASVVFEFMCSARLMCQSCLLEQFTD